METLKTGDILLFNEDASWSFMGLLGNLIKWGTHSNYTHVAMVLKDPTFIHPSLKGLYVWESSWEGEPDPQDGKIKLGVQITPLHEILEAYRGKGHVYVRHLNIPHDQNPFRPSVLSTIHKAVYDKPYDIVPKDWWKAFTQEETSPRIVNRFFCSALVAYIYTMAGVISPTSDWSIVRPTDFSLDGENLNFSKGYSLGKCQVKMF